MPIGSIVAAVAPSVIGGIMGKSGAQTMSGGAGQAAGISAATNAQNQAQLQPYVDAGKTGLAGLTADANIKPFSMADATNSDAMKTALAGGQNAIQTGAAARGGLLSSNTNEALVKFGQDNAAQYQNQAFNQWLAQNQQKIGVDTSLTGVGQRGVDSSISSNNLASGVAQDAALTQAGLSAGGDAALVGGVVGGVNEAQKMGYLKNIFNMNGQPAATNPGASPYYTPATSFEQAYDY